MDSVIWNQYVYMLVCLFWGREREKMREGERRIDKLRKKILSKNR